MINQGQDVGTRVESEEKPAGGTGKAEKRRLELSVAQVAGSALAAVAAAVLASRLGVYGTIIGAGVVSVVATAGGSVFQHLFRRTGEQWREATAQARPRRRAPGGARPRRTGEYGAATTHGTRLRGWKRTAVLTGAVFALAMATVTGIELFAGGPVSNVWGGDRGGTTVGNSVTRPAHQRPEPTPGTGHPTPDGADPARPETGSPDDAGRPGGTDPTGPAGGGPDREPEADRTPGADDGAGRTADPEGTATPAPAPTPSGGAGGQDEAGGPAPAPDPDGPPTAPEPEPGPTGTGGTG
ncbi:hypothetical protein [Streptomyces sp. NPDC018031]|uniref:hypothetical protein n=1 Tax=Streptomyces sp. NPDC018031 TaxID=3365033 RepID=UPI0037BC051E